MKTMFGLAVLCTALLTFVGCSPKQYHTPPSEGVGQFADIPVPRGFELLDSSYSSESQLVRTGVFKYGGGENIEIVEKFYRQNMPKLGWELYSTEAGNKGNLGRYLFYRKAETVCVVYLSRERKTTFIEIQIR